MVAELNAQICSLLPDEQPRWWRNLMPLLAFFVGLTRPTTNALTRVIPLVPDQPRGGCVREGAVPEKDGASQTSNGPSRGCAGKQLWVGR